MALRARILVAVSVALNALLTWMVVREAREVSIAPQPHTTNRLQGLALNKSVKTNVIIRRQYFNWSDVESDNYQTYIANLKSIGCPPATIRDIIVADVNQLYARRSATEIVTGDQQWWLSEPDPEVLEAAATKADTLETERRQLLDSLLGPGWDSSSGSPAMPSRFGGAVLSTVTPEARQAVEHVELESARRYNEYAQVQKAAGKPLDPAEVAKLRLATRSDLAKILSPAQFEEYL
ncbi:MAG: Peptidoglycan-binding LysM, partial [Verrucomicrobiales bacterium]|nr:Peptidoglycan-binding LysM [Verrucomicrobiales bacterium]